MILLDTDKHPNFREWERVGDYWGGLPVVETRTHP